MRLEKQRYFIEDNWFCRYVIVEPPDGGEVLTFPCYRWLVGDVKVELREGTGQSRLRGKNMNIKLSLNYVFFFQIQSQNAVRSGNVS